ncbi:MAG TPA: PfkB family carbohydrate kinase [Nitrospirota bacterium]|nr:PfkB family carbohydrate kinase [Nitrospirota bacterium]
MPVVGIGQCAWDVLAIVDRIPEADTKKEVLVWEEQGGGPVATALTALSRFGIPGTFYGVIGDDREGASIRQSLLDEGVDVRGLVRRFQASSQTAFIAIEKAMGTRTIFWKRPTGDPLTPDELPTDFLDSADFLLLDGLMNNVSLFAARAARKAGVPVMLDAGRVREGMLELARTSDYVIGSEEFARDLGWRDDAEAFRQNADTLSTGIVTITLGSRGSVTYAQGEIIFCPAFAVEVVDTTGAGDVFHGGFLYGLLQKWPLMDTLRFASAAAAMKCRKLGGRKGIPGLEEVFEFLKTS